MDVRSLGALTLALSASACARPALQPKVAHAATGTSQQAERGAAEPASTAAEQHEAPVDLAVTTREPTEAANKAAVASADEPVASSEPRTDPFYAIDRERCPEEMALVRDSVCVDRWEASLVAVTADGGEHDWSPYKSASKAGLTVRAVSRPMVVPQGYISGTHAQTACEASGKRLCTAEEWVSACRGPKDTKYPYGEKRRKYVCSDDSRKVHPVAEVTMRFGLPKERMWYEGMEHPMINQLEKTLHKTGERDKCTNELGIFDMVGNLHEWIADPKGTFRGGFYLDTIINGEGCNYATTAHRLSYHDYSTGFRCCMDAEPAE